MHQWFTPADGAGGIDKDVAMWPSLAGMRTAIGKTGGTVTETDWTADGKTSLAQAARDHKTAPSSILRRTAVHDGEFAADVAGWLDDVFGGKVSAEAPVPHGLVLRVPA